MKRYFNLVSVLFLIVVFLFLFTGCEFFDQLFGKKPSNTDNKDSITGEWEFYENSDGEYRVVFRFNSDGSFYEEDFYNGELNYQYRGNYNYSDDFLTITYKQSWDSDSQTWEDDTEIITLLAIVKDDELWFTIDSNDDEKYDTGINIIYSGADSDIPDGEDYTIVFEKI